MKLFTFGHEARKEVVAIKVAPAPAAVTSRPETPAWSKALTAAVVMGGFIAAAKSASEPHRGGIEVTRITY